MRLELWCWYWALITRINSNRKQWLSTVIIFHNITLSDTHTIMYLLYQIKSALVSWRDFLQKHLQIYKYFLFKCNYFKFLVSSVHLFTHTECNVILFSHLNIIIFSVSTAPVPVWSTSGKPWKSWSRVWASTASMGRWSINETRSLQISGRWRGNVVWCLSNRLQRGS